MARPLAEKLARAEYLYLRGESLIACASLTGLSTRLLAKHFRLQGFDMHGRHDPFLQMARRADGETRR